MRGHSVAGMRTRFQTLPPFSHASCHHPRRPVGVIRAMSWPPETASMGRTAAIVSSATRAASSTSSSRTALYARMVASVPGRDTTRLPFSRARRQGDLGLRGHRPPEGPVRRHHLLE